MENIAFGVAAATTLTVRLYEANPLVCHVCTGRYDRSKVYIGYYTLRGND